MASDVIPTPAPNAIPRKGVLRERFENFKDSALDAAMGKGESWAKKVGYGDQGVKLDDIPKLLAALHLKLVDVNKVCVDRAEHEAYKTLAAAHLSSQPKLDEDWDK
jgi:hypothetical protein